MRLQPLGFTVLLALTTVGAAGAQVASSPYEAPDTYSPLITGWLAPDDNGAGIKRGMTEQNVSAQTGWVTLFPAGNQTQVVLTIFSERPGAVEFADIRRGNCENLPGGFSYRLNPVVNGQSTTWVPAPLSKLLSWNYSASVHWANHPSSRTVSCGSLYPAT